MRLLILYGTTEGQTRKIASYCKNHLTGQGHIVEICDSDNLVPGLEIPGFEAVILAGSVHQERHQENLENLVFARRSELEQIPSLLISVSLSIAFENGEEAAEKYVRSFVENTGFMPANVALVAGALKFDKYGYYMNQIIEHVVLKNREKITEDREFTDWKKLEHALDEFVSA